MAAFKAPSTATFGGSDVSIEHIDGLSPIRPHSGGASPHGVAVPAVSGSSTVGAGGGSPPTIPSHSPGGEGLERGSQPTSPSVQALLSESWEMYEEEMGNTPPSNGKAKIGEGANKGRSPSTPRGGFTKHLHTNLEGTIQDKSESQSSKSVKQTNMKAEDQRRKQEPCTDPAACAARLDLNTYFTKSITAIYKDCRAAACQQQSAASGGGSRR